MHEGNTLDMKAIYHTERHVAHVVHPKAVNMRDRETV
jgi:hypothetical protein